VQGRVEQLGLRFVSYFRRGHCEPTNRYGSYLPVGMLIKAFVIL
jgi:hypothetical protein